MPIFAWLAARLGTVGAKVAAAALAVGAFFLWLARVKASARKEGAQRERAKLGGAWKDHENQVVQKVDEVRAGGADAARQRMRERAGGDSP